MKLLSAALGALLALQAPPKLLVFGPQAATIRPADLEAIARAVSPYGGAPWLLTHFSSSPRSIGGQRQWHARVHLAPSTATSEFRRGPLIDLTTEHTTQDAPDSNTWKVDDRVTNLTWAQVALPGRSFDDVMGESDENLPLAIRGQIAEADLLSSVRFLRTHPPLPKPRPGLIVPTVPGPVRGVLAPAFLNPSLPAVRLSLAADNGCLWTVLLQRPWSELLQRRDGEWFVESIERGGGCN